MLDLIPIPVARRLFSVTNYNGTGISEEREQEDASRSEREQILTEIEEILDVFGDSYMNKHFLYSILELIVLRLVPEILDKTPSELLAERGALSEGRESGSSDEIVGFGPIMA